MKTVRIIKTIEELRELVNKVDTKNLLYNILLSAEISEQNADQQPTPGCGKLARLKATLCSGEQTYETFYSVSLDNTEEVIYGAVFNCIGLSLLEEVKRRLVNEQDQVIYDMFK